MFETFGYISWSFTFVNDSCSLKYCTAAHSFIFSNSFILVTMNPESILGTLNLKWEYTLSGMPVQHIAPCRHTHTCIHSHLLAWFWVVRGNWSNFSWTYCITSADYCSFTFNCFFSHNELSYMH